jgi:hypothetical protein
MLRHYCLGMSRRLFVRRLQLWRISELFSAQFMNPGAIAATGGITYDVLSGGYLLSVGNEVDEPYDFNYKASRKDYTTSALRRRGKR